MVEFYKKVLESLGFIVSEDGYVFINAGGGVKRTLEIGKLPLVLPTKANIDSAVELNNATGKVENVKTIFNPLSENVVKKESLVLRRIRKVITVAISGQLTIIGEALLTIAKNSNAKNNLPLSIMGFIDALSSIPVGNGIKKLVDDETVAKWGKIKGNLELTDDQERSIFRVVRVRDNDPLLKANGYYAAFTVESPIYNSLAAMVNRGKLLDVDLRNKDIGVFKELIRFMLPKLESGYLTGSDDKAPGFIAVMTLYLIVMERLNYIADELGLGEIDDMLMYPLTVTKEELAKASETYKKELEKVPEDNVLLNAQKHKSVTTRVPTATNAPVTTKVTSGGKRVVPTPDIGNALTASERNELNHLRSIAATPAHAVPSMYNPPMQPQYGMYGGNPMVPRYGVDNSMEGRAAAGTITGGGLRQPMYPQQPQYGIPQQPRYGAPQQVPVYGMSQQQQVPVYGMPQQQVPAYGVTQQMVPGYGMPQQPYPQQPMYGGIPQQQRPAPQPGGYMPPHSVGRSTVGIREASNILSGR